MEYTDTKLHAGIGDFAQEVNTESARSIELLKVIDITLSSLNRFTAQLHADARYAEKLMQEIDRATAEIDSDNTIAQKLEETQSIVHSVYNELIQRRESGRCDTRLSEDDGIEAAYTEAIIAAAELQNKLNDLRWSILEHDADLSPISAPYTSAEDLIKSLAG
ncbi:MAG: hypothetical protein JSR51_00460 [Proteobacteria bacterium]|nr:hypothetical protein [Pseudomonadota bacterium]